ncbi:MAG: hypothetical protein M1835_004610 [Candelina submexicana]|nr:MAG: hypothetical protein M1835_004610 [Candelina submexicana]
MWRPVYPQGNLEHPSQSTLRDANNKGLDASNTTWGSSILSNHDGKFTHSPRSTERRAKHAADKAFLRMQLLDKSPMSTDWRIPLDILQQAAEQLGLQESEGTETIMVPEGSLARLNGGSGGALWEIKLRNGCQVQILDRETRITDQRPVVLRGSPQTRDIAKEIISSAISGFNDPNPTVFRQPGITFVRSTSSDRNVLSREPPVRAVWTARSDVTRRKRPHQVKPPRTWTATTLANYIEDLVDSNVSRSMHDRLDQKGETHVDEIADIIRGLFNDPSKGEIIFVRALNSALTFLYKFELIHLVRALFLRAEELKIKMVPETFNIMLRGAAAAKDLHNFTFILKIMIKRSVRPNAATWVAFLMAIESKPVKLQILDTMRSMEMLQDRSTIKDAVAQITSGEMVGYLKSGQDLHAFMGDMDNRYGPDWLSVEAANRILHDIGGQGAISEASELFKIMADRSLRPDTTSFNTLLGHCLYQRKVPAAMHLLTSMELDWTLIPDSSTFDLIFKLGWNLRHYNICRVAWHYACMSGKVSYRMHKLVLQSLLRDPSTKIQTIGEAWRASAGQFIVGSAFSGEGHSPKIPQPDYSSSDTNVNSDLLALPEIDGKLMREEAARLLIETDLMSVSSRRPLQRFSSLLRQAWLKDTRVLEKDKLARDVDSLKSMLQNPVNIPWRPI